MILFDTVDVPRCACWNTVTFICGNLLHSREVWIHMEPNSSVFVSRIFTQDQMHLEMNVSQAPLLCTLTRKPRRRVSCFLWKLGPGGKGRRSQRRFKGDRTAWIALRHYACRKSCSRFARSVTVITVITVITVQTKRWTLWLQRDHEIMMIMFNSVRWIRIRGQYWQEVDPLFRAFPFLKPVIDLAAPHCAI